MSLDPRAGRFLQLLAMSGPPRMDTTSIAERRNGLAELMKFGGAVPEVDALDDHWLPGPAGRIAVRLYTGSGAEADRSAGIIYFHGGGLIAGSLETHDSIARSLAAAGRCRVVSVDYRLAPEHPFPAAFEDAVAAATYVTAHAGGFGLDPSRIGVCGDSAGGSLAAAACHAMAGAGEPRLALQLLLCPILDYSTVSASRRELASGYLIDEAMLAHDLRHCLPAGGDTADPRLSPLRWQNLAGLPPTLLHTAQYDPLRDEGRDYAARLSAAGSWVSHTCHAGMIHLFYGLGAVIPHAHRAWEHIGSQLRAQLAPRTL